MSPTRRQVVTAIASTAAVPICVTSAQAQDDQEFSPELRIRSNNLVATVGEREDGSDPDTVTVYTADGTVYEFDGEAEDPWREGEAFDVGYTGSNSRGKIEGWHGIIERVEATKDGQTVATDNDADSTLEVTCSLWKTPDEPPREFTVMPEGATKNHYNRHEDDLSEDERQYGSPGRRLQRVAERDEEHEMQVDFDLDCEPEAEKALYFDCTTVTVEPDELNQGEDRIEDVELRFTDGTYERPPGDADEADNGAYELPVTLAGSGENEGKVIERLQFKVPGGEYYYQNLEADRCTAGEGGGSNDGNEQDGSGSGEGATETETEGGDTETEETPTSDDTATESDQPTETQDAGTAEETATPEATEGPDTDRSTATATDANGGAGGGGVDTDTATETDVASTPEPTARTTETVDATSQATDATAESTATAADTTGGGGGGGAGSTPTETFGAGDDPELTGEEGEPQAAPGVLAGLGSLLGFGELVRRRLDAESDDE